MNQGTCETCRWWNKPATWNGKSRCQFDPPQCIVNSGGDYEDVWPFTSSGDWCSHHTPKPLPATGEKGDGCDCDFQPIGDGLNVKCTKCGHICPF